MTCREGHAPRHPDFEPGNVVSLRHGAYSPATIKAKAEQVHEALLEVAPWCAEARFLPSVNRYLQATAREQVAHEAIMSGGKLSPRLFEVATAAARLAWAMADQLGLTPAGHARLKVLVAGATHAEADVAALARQGAEILRRREAEIATQRPPGSPESDATDHDDLPPAGGVMSEPDPFFEPSDGWGTPDHAAKYVATAEETEAWMEEIRRRDGWGLAGGSLQAPDALVESLDRVEDVAHRDHECVDGEGERLVLDPRPARGDRLDVAVDVVEVRANIAKHLGSVRRDTPECSGTRP